MSYDPHAPPGGPPADAGWIRPLPATPHRDSHPGGGDSLVHLAGLILAAVAVLLLATTAAVVAAAGYGLLTWRRARWWPPVLAGIAGALAVLAAAGGPGPALAHHLLAARELTGPHPGGVADLVAGRWPGWLLAELPLSVPVGLVAAGLARHRVTHLPAHDLSLSAQARRAAEDRAHQERAGRRAAQAPDAVHHRPVLGAWITGDLTDWKAGEWATISDATFGLGTVVLGLPGTGKTETLLRLAHLGLAAGFDVHVIDAKGDPTTQARFAALAAHHDHDPRLFPQEPYDGWRGDPTALRNRLGQVVDYSEPYYQDGTRVLLDAATRAGTTSLDELVARLADPDLEADNQVRKGALSRYRSFAVAAGAHLSGRWAFEDTAASYLLLDGVALGDDTPRLARWLLEDFQHYAAVRKPPGRRALLIVDEFSALRVPNAAALLERLRSFGCGVVIAAQSVEGLHGDPGERARLLGAASTLIAHRLADPEVVSTRAGSIARAERSHQLDHLGATGMGSLRMQDTYRIDPNELRSLPAGVAWITTAGRAAKVAVAQAEKRRTEGLSVHLPRSRRESLRHDPGPDRHHGTAAEQDRDPVTIGPPAGTSDVPAWFAELAEGTTGETTIIEARLFTPERNDHTGEGPPPPPEQGSAHDPPPGAEPQTPPISEPLAEPPAGPSRPRSPYADGL